MHCLLTFLRVDSRLSTCVYKLNLVDRRVRVIARRDALGYAVTEFSPSGKAHKAPRMMCLLILPLGMII